MFTKKEHVKALAKNMLLRLEQDEALAILPQDRQEAFTALFQLLSPLVLTDEEVRAKVIQRLGMSAEALSDSSATESDQYRAAKSVILSEIGENAVLGLYYQTPIKSLAEQIKKFLMKRPEIDEVFWDDLQLERKIVDFIKQFNPESLH